MGMNVEEIWNNIVDQKVGYRYCDDFDSSIEAKFFGFLNEIVSVKGFPKKITKVLPDFAKHALVVSRDAIESAFENGNPNLYYDSHDVGVIYATGWGGQDSLNTNNDAYKRNGLSSPFSNLMSMHSVATAAISMNWKLRGYQNTPIAACAAGSIAIGDAYEIIKSGRQKVMVAGGGESLKETFNVWSIDIIQALSKECNNINKACCPFSKDRSGFVLSEGAAVVVLEDLDSALARGANILGEIIGYANYSDAFDMTSPATDLSSRVKAINDACNQANVSAEDIDYINAHGTSTKLNDFNESECIKSAFGKKAYEIPISSTKSYTGHLIGGAGSMESIFCLKSIETGMIPATYNLINSDPSCDLNYTPNVHSKGNTINIALNLNFGFGGSNSAVIFKRY
jgi:3-oxoacyl-[acyl-carrier-protein] synthase II